MPELLLRYESTNLTNWHWVSDGLPSKEWDCVTDHCVFFVPAFLASHWARNLFFLYWNTIARSRVQTPSKSWIFFETSLCNCINCVHCDDHFFISFHFISVVHIWFISYIINTEIVFVFIKQPNYIQVAENCNLWRSWWDMDVSTMLLVFSLQSHFTTSCFAAGCLCINLFLKRPNSYSEISWCSEMTRQIKTLEKN